MVLNESEAVDLSLGSSNDSARQEVPLKNTKSTPEDW